MKKILFCLILLYSNLLYSKQENEMEFNFFVEPAPICVGGGCYYGDENDRGYGDGPNHTDFLTEYSLETDRIFSRMFNERPTQKDISNFVEQLDRKLNSGETLKSYSSYSLDKILSVVLANNDKEQASLKEDLRTLKNEIENELSSSFDTSKDFTEIHNQKVKDYVESLPFLAQVVNAPNFRNSSPKVKETAFYATYVAKTIKAEDQFLKEAADRALKRADELAQAGKTEASEQALTQANQLLDNALSPNTVPSKEWKSTGEAREIINDLHKKISKVRPLSSDATLGKDVAIAALDEADEAAASGDHDLYEKNLELAKAGLDIALGFVPVANIGQSLYEAITGRSVITGKELGTFGQAMAILGVVTLGTSKTFQASLKAIGRIGEAVLKSTRGASKFREAFSVSSAMIESSGKLGLKTKEAIADFTSTIKYLAGNEVGGIRNVDEILDSTKTVWSKISNQANNITTTNIPSRFNIEAGGINFHVHPNATKHMGARVITNSQSHSLAIYSQMVLSQFEKSVSKVAKSGEWRQAMKEEKVIMSEGWELKFSQREGDVLPVIMHAVYKGN